jgi:hypothetical protein
MARDAPGGWALPFFDRTMSSSHAITLPPIRKVDEWKSSKLWHL